MAIGMLLTQGSSLSIHSGSKDSSPCATQNHDGDAKYISGLKPRAGVGDLSVPSITLDYHRSGLSDSHANILHCMIKD